ncbi:MAG TPA: DUF177 domain-containing protein [Terriglobales bacterium]|nr:DUF177 domain-containing protein [Terriglobales bacterium]
MRIDISPVLKNDGEQIDFDTQLDLSELEGAYGEKPLREPVHVCGRVSGLYGAVRIAMEASGKLHFLCDRCTKPYELDFCYPLDAMVTTDPAAEETDELIYAKDSRVDLSAQTAALIGLHMPFKHLCKEDCKGLCPICGTDKNEGECGCEPDRSDPRWDALRELFDKHES